MGQKFASLLNPYTVVTIMAIFQGNSAWHFKVIGAKTNDWSNANQVITHWPCPLFKHSVKLGTSTAVPRL